MHSIWPGLAWPPCEDAALNAAMAFAEFPDHEDGPEFSSGTVVENFMCSDEAPIPTKSLPNNVKRRRV